MATRCVTVSPMKLLLSLALLASSAAATFAGDWRPLFDGTMNGWRTWLALPEPSSQVDHLAKGANGKYTEKLGWDRDPLGVFTIVEVDGRKAVRTSGEVFGLLLTNETYSNFRFRFQFKWGEKKWPPRQNAVRDCGLLYFINGEQGRSYVSWPSSLEMQIQEKDTGDLYALLAGTNVRAKFLGKDPKGYPRYHYDSTEKPTWFEQEGANGNRVIRLEDFDKPVGEWNTIEVVCFGSDSIHIVNGHVVMRLTDAKKQDGQGVLDSGLLGLQSEGAEVFYRDMEIQSISAIPAEYAEKP